MASERRTTGERRAPTTVSVRRLEGKIDEVIKRQDAMHLNGDISALREMAAFWRESSPQLRQLVQVAPTIIDAVERDRDMAAFWRVTRRIFNPLRPLGAFLWLLFTTVATAIVWNIVTRH